MAYDGLAAERGLGSIAALRIEQDSVVNHPFEDGKTELIARDLAEESDRCSESGSGNRHVERTPSDEAFVPYPVNQRFTYTSYHRNPPATRCK